MNETLIQPQADPDKLYLPELRERLRDCVSRSNWEAGDIAEQIGTTYNGAELQSAAEYAGVPYQTLLQYRRAAVAFKNCNRLQNLSWTHHFRIAGRADRLEWLQLAADNNWSIREMEDQIAALDAATPAAEIVTTDAKGKPSKTRAAVRARRKKIEEMARANIRSGTIADAVGLSEETVRRTIQDLGIPQVEDLIGRMTKKIDVNRAVQSVVADAVPPETVFNMIYGGWDRLDRDRFPAWVDGLNHAIKELNKLRNALRKGTP